MINQNTFKKKLSKEKTKVAEKRSINIIIKIFKGVVMKLEQEYSYGS